MGRAWLKSLPIQRLVHALNPAVRSTPVGGLSRCDLVVDELSRRAFNSCIYFKLPRQIRKSLLWNS